eukprot:Gb_21473 [translate_table: standard]
MYEEAMLLIYEELKALGIDNIMGFDWLASPPAEAMVRALEVLYSIGVLDEDGKLTSPTGFQVAEIPLGLCLLSSLIGVANWKLAYKNRGDWRQLLALLLRSCA